jgi:hypothetical protein
LPYPDNEIICFMKRLKPERKGSIYDLLESIKDHPGLYLRSRTLDSLSDFLTGFSVGQCGAFQMEDGDRSFGDFSAWFCHHHRAAGAGAGGWYVALKDRSADDKKAFDSFFTHLTDFRRRTLEYEHHFKLTPAQRHHYAAKQGSPAPDKLRLSHYRRERCLFLHAQGRGQRGWYLHTVFKSISMPYPYLSMVFGIKPAEWDSVAK